MHRHLSSARHFVLGERFRGDERDRRYSSGRPVMPASSRTRRSEIWPSTGSRRSRSNFSTAARVSASKTPVGLIWPKPKSASARCTAVMRFDGAIGGAINLAIGSAAVFATEAVLDGLALDVLTVRNRASLGSALIFRPAA